MLAVQTEAAEALGLSTTALKKACRKLGLLRSLSKVFRLCDDILLMLMDIRMSQITVDNSLSVFVGGLSCAESARRRRCRRDYSQTAAVPI